jgi:hypothetical protein
MACFLFQPVGRGLPAQNGSLVLVFLSDIETIDLYRSAKNDPQRLNLKVPKLLENTKYIVIFH